MNYFVVTNNPLVIERFSQHSDKDINRASVIVKDDFRDVLCECRDRVHAGAKLISHPLSGSVKPWETPYRSVLVTANHADLHYASLETIEQAIERYDALVKSHTKRHYAHNVDEDFQLIDASLLNSAEHSLRSAFLS